MVASDTLEELRSVDATMHYLADDVPAGGDRWLQFWINDASRTNMVSAPHGVTMRDARPIADRLDLDREGFRLVPHRSAVRDYRDPADVAKHQPRELEELVKEITGAAKVFGIGPMLRFGDHSPENEGRFNSKPAHFVHADFVDESIHWFFDRWPDVRSRIILASPVTMSGAPSRRRRRIFRWRYVTRGASRPAIRSMRYR